MAGPFDLAEVLRIAWEGAALTMVACAVGGIVAHLLGRDGGGRDG